MAAAQPVHAQADLLGPGAGYLAAGVSSLATGDLDARLEQRGYPTFGRTATAFGVGAYRLLASGVMIGFEGQGFVVGDDEHQGRDVGVSGGYATLGVAYGLRLSPRTRVYPRIGIGAGGLALENDAAPDTIGFDDVLDTPTPAPIEQDPVLSRDGVVFDVGGGAELLSRRDHGFLLGLRAGYLFAPWSDGWDLVYRGPVRGGPDASVAGPYVRLTLGWAWRR